MKKLVISLFVLCVSSVAWSIPVPFKEGHHYTVIEGAELSPTQEVTEYFSYSCPHCYHAEPLVKAFLKDKPKGVVVNKVPVGFFIPRFEITREGAIVAEVLGKKDSMHDAFFQSIHGAGGKHFASNAQLITFFGKHQVSADAYKKALASPEAEKLNLDYRKKVAASKITGVPAFIVNNKYLVAHSKVANVEEFVFLLKFLLAKDNVKVAS